MSDTSHRSWMRTPEAAAYVQRAESTLEKLRHYGGGPAYSRAGKVVVYHPDDLDAWLKSSMRVSTSQAQAA